MRAFTLRSLAALTLLVASACNDATSPEIVVLSAAESRWRATVPSNRSYTMQQRVACYCPSGGDYFTVTIAGGVVTSATNSETGTDAPTWLIPRFKTVPQLFEEIRRASATRGTLVAVAYDATLGYPTTVSLDPIREAIDDEVAYETRSLVVNP